MVKYTLHYFKRARTCRNIEVYTIARSFSFFFNFLSQILFFRLIFAAAGVNFDDHRIGEDWNKSKQGKNEILINYI
jgi:hypothetical protein